MNANKIDFDAAENVRLELIQHENPEGLHRVEAQWRDLCRKLLARTLYLEGLLEAHHEHWSWSRGKTFGTCEICKERAFTKLEVPEIMTVSYPKKGEES